MSDYHPITITPQSNVAEILRAWPQLIPVFLRHRMSCVGCSMSAFETLGDALHIYGLSVEPFLSELQRAVAAAPNSDL